jgi:hypothetical protein
MLRAKQGAHLTTQYDLQGAAAGGVAIAFKNPACAKGRHEQHINAKRKTLCKAGRTLKCS